MNEQMTQAEIDELKTTWTAFGGLSKKQREFLESHKDDVLVVNIMGGWSPLMDEEFFCGKIYRLPSSFQLPKKRWLYSQENHHIYQLDDELVSKDIEVTAEDVSYVQKCIDLHKAGKVDLKEFEFRKLVKGETATWLSQCCATITEVITGLADEMFFVRRHSEMKPATEPAQWDGYSPTCNLRFVSGKLQQAYECCYQNYDNQWRDVEEFK